MVFQDRKIAIRSPKTLEFAPVKPKRVTNEHQVGFRALCHSLVYPRICSLVSILRYSHSTSHQGETVSIHNRYFSLGTHHTDQSCTRYLPPDLNPPKHMQLWSQPQKIWWGCCSCKSFTVFDKTFAEVPSFLWQTSNHQWFKSLWERHQVNPKPRETEQLWMSFALKF